MWIDRLHVLIDPDWQNVVLPSDRDFFEMTLADFRDRASKSPADLFKQASELNFGPLITLDTGLADINDERIAEMIRCFVPV